MSHFVLTAGNQSPLALAIRQAIGATETEDIEVQTPEFDRPAAWEPAMLPPTERADWHVLQTLKRDDLRAWGCRPFALFSTEARPDSGVRHRDAWYFPLEDDEATRATHELWLFPAEWYASIPNGFPVTDINGCTELFEAGRTDDDRRLGMLAYGLMIRYQ